MRRQLVPVAIGPSREPLPPLPTSPVPTPPVNADGSVVQASDGTLTLPVNGDDSGQAGASLLPADFTSEPEPVEPVVESAMPPVGNGAPVAAAIVVSSEGNGTAPAPLTGPPLTGRARSLANLEPHRFQRGRSGNVNGRPKGIVSKALTKALKRKMTDSDERVVEALCREYTAKALEELDPARFNSIRDTVDGRPASQDDGAGASVTVEVVLSVVGQ